MGSKPCVCIVRINLVDCPPSSTGWSVCGSDAFYRDAFLDQEEEGRSQSSCTGRAWEQAVLKSMKGQVFLQNARYSAKGAGVALHRMLTKETMSPEPPYHAIRTLSDWTNGSDWLGKTMQEWRDDGLPPVGSGPRWKKGEGDGLQVRCGPDYLRGRTMMETQRGHLYDCLTFDAIRAPRKIDEIIGQVIHSVPPQSKSSRWTRECLLPRVLCINVMLPHYNPKNPWASDDGGCSYVGFFEIANATIETLFSDRVPAHVKLFQEFCEGPAGTPGGPLDDPNRSLGRRRDPSKRKDQDRGLLRAAGWCQNQAELGVPDFLHQFNGKSFVISDSGYIIRDPQGEWIEFGFDVRQFPFLMVDILYNFRDFIPRAKIHYGFTLQAVDDEDLPEGIICDMYMAGVNIVEDPVEVQIGWNRK